MMCPKIENTRLLYSINGFLLTCSTFIVFTCMENLKIDGELIEVKIVHDIWNNKIHAPRNIKKCTLARSQPGDLKFNIFVDK